MLEKPSINELAKKTGENRYSTALLIAKRARQIADKRTRTESEDIRDCVDIATHEVYEDKVKMTLNKEEKEEIIIE